MKPLSRLRQLAVIALLSGLSGLSACSILPKTAPLQIYLLPSEASAPSTAAAVNWSLRINQPQASQTLDSARIAVLPQANLISSYADSRWSDPAPQLLRNHLINAFQHDGRLDALSSDNDNLQADFTLGGELQAFQSEYQNGAVTVRLRLHAQLIDSRSQRIIASQRFEVRQPVSDRQVPGVVVAFGQASDQLAAQLLNWTLQQGQAHAKQP
jgi:cholesterol transport system auxiliary component